MLTDWSTDVSGEYSIFEATTGEVALNMVLGDIRSTLNRATGGNAERRR